MGHVEFLVTFREAKTTRQVKTHFLLIECPSLYNCIFGRPTLAEVTVLLSAVHLKMKYYTNRDHFFTVHGDIKATRKCYDETSKGHNLIATVSKSDRPTQPAVKLSHKVEQKSSPQVTSADDTRFTKDELKEKKK